jgi:luciferase-type oxidoreductase
MADFNRAYGQVFVPGRLTVGLMTPMAGPPGALADLGLAQEHARLADALGFAALWTRDVPLMIPQGSAHETAALDDPFLWLAALAAMTERIALATGAIVLPLRHPLHVAKAALSLDRISRGRVLLGLGSGDRPEEFSRFGADLDTRDAAFRDHWGAVRAALEPAPAAGVDDGQYRVLPPPQARIPMLAVGSARQSLQWIAEHADGWASYHREEDRQKGRIALWHMAQDQRSPGMRKPFIQSVQLDLLDDPAAPPEAIELGLRTGRHALAAYLERMRELGVAHILFNLHRGPRPVEDVLRELGAEILPRLQACLHK